MTAFRGVRLITPYGRIRMIGYSTRLFKQPGDREWTEEAFQVNALFNGAKRSEAPQITPSISAVELAIAGI
jgi:hypothetical protein